MRDLERGARYRVCAAVAIAALSLAACGEADTPELEPTTQDVTDTDGPGGGEDAAAAPADELAEDAESDDQDAPVADFDPTGVPSIADVEAEGEVDIAPFVAEVEEAEVFVPAPDGAVAVAMSSTDGAETLDLVVPSGDVDAIFERYVDAMEGQGWEDPRGLSQASRGDLTQFEQTWSAELIQVTGVHRLILIVVDDASVDGDELFVTLQLFKPQES